MPFVRFTDGEGPIIQPACKHLRSKAMYVAGQFGDSAEIDASASPCWCNLTQHVIGPDDKSVSRRGCITGRDCYVERV